jgi:hypothetical protein
MANSEPDNDEWREHSAQCLEQAAAADILLLYVDREDARHFGSLIEAGAALGAGKQVFVVAPHRWPFLRNHSSVPFVQNVGRRGHCRVGRRWRARTPSRCGVVQSGPRSELISRRALGPSCFPTGGLPCTSRDIRPILDPPSPQNHNSLILLARPTGIEPVFPP